MHVAMDHPRTDTYTLEGGISEHKVRPRIPELYLKTSFSVFACGVDLCVVLLPAVPRPVSHEAHPITHHRGLSIS